jgi:chemotaxis protein MotA
VLALIGVAIILVTVFGAYLASGGKMSIILHALPFELTMILGAGIGAFIISNPMHVTKGALKDLKFALKGSHWTKQDFQDLLCLMFSLIKLMRQRGAIAVEPHVDAPGKSEIFKRYPHILDDHFVLPFIADTMRMMTMNVSDPHQVEDAMEKQLRKHHAEILAPAGALQTLADGTPALGIVAAVLGVIKTMASIDQPPAVLGLLIGGALVGTFLGVFLAYGLIGPFAARIRQAHQQDHQFYAVVRDALVAFLHGHSPQVSVEVARGNVPSHFQPSFQELETALGHVPTAS